MSDHPEVQGETREEVSAPQTSAEVSLDEDTGFSRAFWLTLITLLLVVGGLEIYGAYSLEGYVEERAREVGSSPKSQADEERSQASKSGERDQGRHRAWREELIKASFAEARADYAELGVQVKEDARRELKTAREELLKRIPTWADWYYSVIGEYVRLGHLGAQAAGEGDFGEYMLEQLSERVFKPARLSERLAELNTRSQGRFARRQTELVKHLTEVLKHHQLAEDGWTPREREALEARFQSLGELEDLSTVSPLGLAAKLTTLTGLKLGLKALAARSATKLGSAGLAKGAAMTGLKAGGKLGVKAGVRGGSALTSGASATAACSPLGLAAPLCGIAAAAVVWVAVDKAIVEVDELLTREDFEKQLSIELNGLMDEIEADVLKGLDQHQARVLERLFETKRERLDRPPPSTRIIDHLHAPNLKHIAPTLPPSPKK